MMSAMKGWKTILFNLFSIGVVMVPEARDAVIDILGGDTNAVLAYTGINILLRLVTTSPVAILWITKEEQNGVQIQQKKP